jgi:hypothetical protein
VPEPKELESGDSAPVLPQEIEIIPGLPDPNNGRIYRIQVGSFSASESALKAEQLVSSAGFSAGRELNGSLFRVLAINIAASDVNAAIQKLGTMGFRQFWVRD